MEATIANNEKSILTQETFVNRLRTRQQTLENSIKIVQSTSASNEDASHHFQEKIRIFQKEIAALDLQKKALIQEKADLGEIISKKDSEWREQQAMVENYSKTLENQQAFIRSLQVANIKLEGEKSGLMGKVEKLEEELGAVQERAGGVRREEGGNIANIEN